MGAVCCKRPPVGTASSRVGPSTINSLTGGGTDPSNLHNIKRGSCDSGLSSVGSGQDIEAESLEKFTGNFKETIQPQNKTLVSVVPAPVPRPRSIIYDPKNTHENYLKWSKTRLVVRDLSEDDLPQVVSNVCPRIVTPKTSRERDMGRVVEVLDDRKFHFQVTQQWRPTLENGLLWTDSSFTKEVAMVGLADVDWKRPKDICSHPVLFCDGASRYDIGQGSAGTCWFLCILTSLADKPEYLSQIIPPDAYHISQPYYDGIFHCRLWKLGSWCDIYIDDYLPVSRQTGKLWGAHSATDDNEMWVALMEKAFAKFHGGYAAVKGGTAGDAFVTLTGGVEEDLHLENVASFELFSRMDNALRSGAILACSVPMEHDGIHGLSGGHAYTINSIAEVPFRGRLVPLVRLRNPWGKFIGEWRGAWCDGAPQWKEVRQEVKDSLGFREAGDGEFWMALVDFYQYIWRAFVCNFTPDFNSDGFPNGLDCVWSILGEWIEIPITSTPGRAAWLQNSKYAFTITESQHADMHNIEDIGVGMCPIVIQLLQDDMDGEYLYVRCDLYRVNQSWENNSGTHVILSELTNEKVYMGAADHTYRYVLPPGRYIMIPRYSDNRKPEQPITYCLRVFTTQRLQCIALDWDSSTHVYLSSLKSQHEEAGHQFNLSVVDHWLNEWKLGVNSGGQACRPMYHTNPQYVINIPAGPASCQLGVCISQELCAPMVPLGMDIYQVPPDGVPVPLDVAALARGTQQCSRTVGGSFVFVRSHSARGYYSLRPGRYVMLVFSNDVTDEKRFIVTIAANQPITCRAYQNLPHPEESLKLV